MNNIDTLRKAWGKICAIENQFTGADWQEIEEAREIAREALAASKTDPQAQAGEPEVFTAGKHGEMQLITLQSHREAMAKANSLMEMSLATIESLREAIAKKDAALLKACMDAGERAKSALSEAIMIAPLTHIPPSASAAIQELDVAITKAQDALK